MMHCISVYSLHSTPCIQLKLKILLVDCMKWLNISIVRYLLFDPGLLFFFPLNTLQIPKLFGLLSRQNRLLSYMSCQDCSRTSLHPFHACRARLHALLHDPSEYGVTPATLNTVSHLFLTFLLPWSISPPVSIWQNWALSWRCYASALCGYDREVAVTRS